VYLRIIAIFIFCYSLTFAQEVLVDSTYIFEADPIIVTAERYESFKSNSSSAVSVVREGELGLLPVEKLSDAISTSPGLAFVHRDGLGEDPIINIRGFYGGGEAEYFVILVDGKPLNDLESGLINWNSLPLGNLYSIEILRGGSSSLYGDAAIGGVINLKTKNGKAQNTRLMLTGGNFNTYKAQFYTDTKRLNIYGSTSGTDGYRDHAHRGNETLGGSFQIIQNPDQLFTVSFYNYWIKFDVPGPLSGEELAVSPTQSSDYYRFDRTDERKHKISLDYNGKLSDQLRLKALVAGEYRNAEEIETLPLSPDFSDTKERMLSTTRFEAAAQIIIKDVLIPQHNTLIAGFDFSVGSLDSKYYQFFQGSAEDYRNAAAVRGDEDASGEGDRSISAVFIQYEVQVLEPLRLTLGGRYDWISDSFTPSQPPDDDNFNAQHEAFSPKLGLNYKYLDNSIHKANLYINYSGSFKAPTLDQLYDQRSIPAPFPPFSITLSNQLLKPQYGKGGEIGLYHSFVLNANKMIGELSLAAYSMDMKDEIDFDLQQFKYVNIGKSRHQGLEAGFRLQITPQVNTFINFTHQEATSQYGSTDGKYLKGIPRQVINAGISGIHASGFGAGLIAKSYYNIYLDEENTVTLPDYFVMDLKLSYDLVLQPLSLRLSIEVLNLFNKKYSTTGFLDPAGTPGLVYYYPAAERYFRAGLGVQL
jgi:vitamin B12 transporter